VQAVRSADQEPGKPVRKEDSGFQPLEKILEGTGTRNLPLPEDRIFNKKWILLAVLLVVAGALIFLKC
jgi:hypothetical protein